MVVQVGIRCGAFAATAPRAPVAIMATGFQLPLRCPSSLLSTRLTSSLQRTSAAIFTTSYSCSSLSLLTSLKKPSWSLASRSLRSSVRTISSSCKWHTQSDPPSTPPPVTRPPTSKQPLSEDILTLPNLLTMLRLLLTPYIGYLVATHQFVPACTLLFFASITDVLDGWLARKTAKYTVFGSIADPAADKALVTTMVISLAMSGMLPWSLATVILSRDLALVISAFIIRYQTLQQPKTLTRYFNPKLPSATVTPTTISKYNTFLQLVLLGLLTLYPILFPNQSSPTLCFTPTNSSTSIDSQTESSTVQDPSKTLIQEQFCSNQTKLWIDRGLSSLMWLVAFTTVWSGLGYIGGAGTHKVLAARASKVRNSLTKPKPKPNPKP